ncbi:cobalamin B12-binding domain-containing protein [bacterium]|nr:cobalamin B12-binding domain-containing protein [bacterium]
MAQLDAITAALGALKEDEAKTLIQAELAAGTPATELLTACQNALALVGNKFESGEYFISELMYAGEIMKGIMADLNPHLKDLAPPDTAAQTVVFGTVNGDIHDIGKDVCILMLRGAGYQVVDLGVNVPATKFVDAVREHKPFLLGLSVFLTTCCKAIDEVVAALEDAGLRDGVQIMIGGAAASDFVAERTGCDTYGKTAVHAVQIASSVAGA